MGQLRDVMQREHTTASCSFSSSKCSSAAVSGLGCLIGTPVLSPLALELPNPELVMRGLSGGNGWCW